MEEARRDKLCPERRRRARRLRRHTGIVNRCSRRPGGGFELRCRSFATSYYNLTTLVPREGAILQDITITLRVVKVHVTTVTRDHGFIPVTMRGAAAPESYFPSFRRHSVNRASMASRTRRNASSLAAPAGAAVGSSNGHCSALSAKGNTRGQFSSAGSQTPMA